MTTNGSKANRDEKELQRCADMVSVNTLDLGLANFRNLARKILRSPRGGWDSRKKRLFVKALEAIERGCENNERWAVQFAMSLTIGSLRDFVESEVATPEGGFEVTVQETETQTRTRTQRLTLEGPLAHQA
jgi:hypothetical protein